MNKIEIIKSPNADSRTNRAETSMYELEDATIQHIHDVRNGLLFFAEQLNFAGWSHDFTKRAYLEEFYADFISLQPGEEFKAGKWYQTHIHKERHHLLANPPENVNLIDILEYVTDCVMAGLARSGEVTELSLPDDILRKALTNTTELLKNNVKVLEPGETPSETQTKLYSEEEITDE